MYDPLAGEACFGRLQTKEEAGKERAGADSDSEGLFCAPSTPNTADKSK